MVQVAHQGAGAPQVHGGLGCAFARNSLEYAGLRGEGSTPVPLPPPSTWAVCYRARLTSPKSPTNGDLLGERPYWRSPKRRQFAVGDDIFLQSFVLRSFSTVLKTQRRAQ